MSLDYNIYWIDDDEDLPKSLLEGLEIHYDGALKFEYDIDGDGANLEKKLASEPIDLLILDWNIDGDRTGLQLINDLRSSGELTEVIFYSQDEKVKDQCKDIMGVHTCQKGEADGRIRTVIDRFRDRAKNVALMRGMIISEAIDLENRLTDLIVDLFGDKGELFKSRVLNKPLLDFGKKHGFINGLLKDRISSLRATENPDEEKVKQLVDMKEVFNQMMKEIVNQRNILAHSKKSFEDGVLVLSSLNNDPAIHFNDEWKNDIRANIKKHLGNLVAIREALVEESLIVA